MSHWSVERRGAIALAWLLQAQERPAESFMWLQFSLANTAAVRWMRSHLSAPQSRYDSLQHSAVSARIEQEDAALVAVIHDALFDAEFDSSNVALVSAYVEPHMLVSARLRPLRSVDQLRAAVRLRRPLAPEPAALFRLLSRPPPWVGGDDLQDRRQSGEAFSTAVADSVALVERVRLLQ